MPTCSAAEVTATTTLFYAGGEFQIYVSFAGWLPRRNPEGRVGLSNARDKAVTPLNHPLPGLPTKTRLQQVRKVAWATPPPKRPRQYDIEE